MFEHYLVAQTPAATERRNLNLSLGAACIVVLCMIGTMWTHGKLHIQRVGAPRLSMLETLTGFTFTPPPKPTPPPKALKESAPQTRTVAASATPPSRTENSVNSSDDVQPADRPGETRPNPLARTQGSPCPPGVTCTTDGPKVSPLVAGPAQTPKSPTSLAPVAFRDLKCISCPDPNQSKLRQVGLGGSSSSMKNATSFCVDKRGRVLRVKTQRSSGHAEVDRIVRQTVSSWRFRPRQVRGKAVGGCSSVSFSLRFD